MAVKHCSCYPYMSHVNNININPKANTMYDIIIVSCADTINGINVGWCSISCRFPCSFSDVFMKHNVPTDITTEQNVHFVQQRSTISDAFPLHLMGIMHEIWCYRRSSAYTNSSSYIRWNKSFWHRLAHLYSLHRCIDALPPMLDRQCHYFAIFCSIISLLWGQCVV